MSKKFKFNKIIITDNIGGNFVNSSDLQKLIEDYKKELIRYANESEIFIKSEEEKPRDSIPAAAIISSPDNTMREADIEELEGTNPTGYNAGRVEPQYKNDNEFRSRNKGKGIMKVQVYSGREAFPVVSANVLVTKDFDDGIYTYYDLLTDTSGIVEGLSLVTPDSKMAQEDNTFVPYSTYTVKVTHPNYITTVYTNVPVFDGITSIQPVNLMPKTGTPTDDEEIIYTDEEPKDL